MTRPTLVFVYNADSGLFNTLSDIAHKMFSPDTYDCHLCAITYGTFAIRKEWQEYLGSLDAELEFLHRDQLQSRYGVADHPLPAVFRKDGDRLTLWIGTDEIARCRDVDDLKQLVTTRLTAGSP